MSLVDGFIVPVTMTPIGGGVGCGVAACAANLNRCCPSALNMKITSDRIEMFREVDDDEKMGCKVQAR